ncbi:hypothetical protein CA260_18320 [Dyella jiangningensis]|uniref:Uncharacterized protein n=1 Tax=Dyella jiangningensis TaxID=1379159 RepID=A0A328P279_9GAMM|nr:hypothetical protein CA260_18320 [Dyella jiangningensis]
MPGAPADAGDARTPAHHLRLVNATFDSVTAFAMAPAGSGAYVEASFASPLQGGLSSTTVSVPSGDCLRDVRVTFINGRVETYPMLDVCRHSGLRLTNGGGKSFRPGLLVAGD